MDNTPHTEPTRILLFSFDWRNMYEGHISEIIEKLERDHLSPHVNKFFSINWGPKSYYRKISENIETVHLKARMGRTRVFYDIADIFITPFLLKKHGFRPDIVLLYDFPSENRLATNGNIVCVIGVVEKRATLPRTAKDA